MLNGNIIKSDDTGRYIAYFDELPELTAEADNEEEVKERLVRGLIKILARNNPTNGTTGIPLNPNSSNVKHFELSAAI